MSGRKGAVGIRYWLRTYSIITSITTSIVRKARRGGKVYVLLYDVLIAILLGILVISIIQIVFHGAVLASQAWADDPKEISQLTYCIAETSLGLQDSEQISQSGHCDHCIVNENKECKSTIQEIIKNIRSFVGPSEKMSWTDMLALMATTMGIVVGLYGIVSQLYSKEWGSSIFFGRPFIYLKARTYKCPDKPTGSSHTSLLQLHAKLISQILFPAKNQLRVLSYDSLFVFLVVLALLHFTAVAITGSAKPFIAPLELIVFLFIMAASIITIWLSAMLKPPMATHLYLFMVRSNLTRLSKKNPSCMPTALGLTSLFLGGWTIPAIIYTTLLIILGTLFGLASLPYPYMPPWKEGIVLIVYITTAIIVSMYLGIINNDIIHELVSDFLNLLDRLRTLSKQNLEDIWKTIKLSIKVIAIIIISIITIIYIGYIINKFIYNIPIISTTQLLKNVNLLTLILGIYLSIIISSYIIRRILSKYSTSFSFEWLVSYKNHLVEMRETRSDVDRAMIDLESAATTAFLTLMMAGSLTLATLAKQHPRHGEEVYMRFYVSGSSLEELLNLIVRFATSIQNEGKTAYTNPLILYQLILHARILITLYESRRIMFPTYLNALETLTETLIIVSREKTIGSKIRHMLLSQIPYLLMIKADLTKQIKH